MSVLFWDKPEKRKDIQGPGTSLGGSRVSGLALGFYGVSWNGTWR